MTRHASPQALVALPLALLALLGSCGDGTGPGPVPAHFSPVGGDRVRGPVGSALEAPMVVEVTDRKRRPIAGVPVTWTVREGEGSLSSGVTTTDAGGKAFVILTPGEVGLAVVAADVPGLDRITFRAYGQAERADPAGDARASDRSAGLVPPDLVRVVAWPEEGNLMVTLEFAGEVALLHTGGANVAVGFLDIDVDSDSGTGVSAGTDFYRTDGGATGLGVEYFVTLSTAGGGSMRVRRMSDGSQVGTFTPTLTENRVLTLPIPLSLLGDDDGLVNLAVTVGTVPEPTDIVPDNGSLVMAGAHGQEPSGAP